MDTAPGRRAALTMTGLGSGADAAGLAALHGGVASAAEASLLPPRGNIAERAHRSPEQDTAAPGLQADSILCIDSVGEPILAEMFNRHSSVYISRIPPS